MAANDLCHAGCPLMFAFRRRKPARHDRSVRSGSVDTEGAGDLSNSCYQFRLTLHASRHFANVNGHKAP